MLLSGVAIAQQAEDTQHQELDSTEKIISGITSFLPSLEDIGVLSITSPDRGQFVAGETVELTGERMCIGDESWSTTWDPAIWLRVTDPSGTTVFSQSIDEWSYAKSGTCYRWNGNWDIPSDIGGESGDYTFEMWLVNDYREKHWCDGDANPPEGGWDFEDCVTIISSGEFAQFDIDPGEPDDTPPDAEVRLRDSSQNPRVGESVALTAEDSTDDNGIICFDWIINNREIENNCGQDLHYTFDQRGEYDVTVIAEDARDQRSSDTITVHVESEENQKPNAVAEVTDRSPRAGDSVFFTADQSSDADGEVTSYEWSIGRNVEHFSHAFETAGTQTVELTVTDNDGATATDTVTIDVKPGDSDGDGVLDPNDNCQDTEGLEQLDGCPNSKPEINSFIVSKSTTHPATTQHW